LGVLMIPPIRVAVQPPAFVALVPGFSMLAAAGIAAVAQRAQERSRPLVAAVLIAWMATSNIPVLATLASRASWDGLNWRSAAAEVEARAAPTDVIAFIPGFFVLPFSRYFHGNQQRLIVDPTLLARPSAAGAALPTQRLAQQGRALWIVAGDGLPLEVSRQVDRLLDGVYVRESARSYDHLVVVRYRPVR